ncbi:MAG: GTP-binding protein [Bacteroidales bacterium]|nr:GTP-binding protein [Bacteroidales bacterium]MBR4637081.1 GTP-binding protein [Bacteroidales bacterium]
MMKKDVPVLLLTGYLGSGKTTLVNHILTNRKGIKFAVIVNDIGEVNVDASLIQKGGVVAEKDDSLVALQNGCICCTLKMNLVDQLSDLVKTQQFDYIVIEASGICEPEPIARTISTIPRMNPKYTEAGTPRLDCIVTVVDALRMQSEFSCGGDLEREDIDEEDIENLLVQQIEFCNIVLLNKVSEVTEDEMERVKEIIRHLNPGAEIIETDYAQVDLDRIVGTKAFDYERVAVSTGWVRELERETTEEEEREARADHHHHDEDTDDHHEHGDHHHHHDDDDDEHEHHHHHHHDHEGGEVEEYGISTFVYYRRKAFKISEFNKFLSKKRPKNIIRAKGVCYFKEYRDMSYLYEQAGVQQKLTEAGLWYATAPQEDLVQLMQEDPSFMRDWDPEYGDRMIKIVFIGQHMDIPQLTRELDDCLED